MRFYTKILAFCFLISVGQLSSQIDSANKSRFILNFYPSQVFVGDIPIGVGYKTSKIVNEAIFMPKLYDTFLNKYFRGYSFRYFFKYSFFKRKHLNLSFDGGLFYKYVYYFNKVNSWYKYPDPSYGLTVTTNSPKFQMDEIIRSYGVTLAASVDFLFRRFHFECNAGIDYGEKIEKYSIKYFVGGTKPIDLVQLPYSETKTKQIFFPFFLISIGYEL